MSTLSAGITAVSYVWFHFTIGTIFWVVGCRTFGCKVPPRCGDFEEVNATAESPLKVVLPSVGQTGTTSVAIALSKMGYKSYHIEEKYVYAHRMLWDRADHSEFRRAVAGCGIEAVALEPPIDSLPLALATSPNAKHIMTWRDFPSWIKSNRGLNEVHYYVGKDERWQTIWWHVAKSWKLLPWGFVWDRLTGQISDLLASGVDFTSPEKVTPLRYTAQRLLGIYGIERLDNALWRGAHKFWDEESYIAHMNEIWRTVPPENLLVFDVRKHGWAELERFLGRPGPPAGVPFPHPRSSASFSNDCMFDLRLDVGTFVAFVFLFLHVLNFTMVHLAVKACLFVLRVLLSPLQRLGVPVAWLA